MNDLLLLALDYLILSNIVISNSTLSKPYRSRVFIMLVTIISTISFHLAYFVLLKEKNIFETHQTARFDDRIAQAAKTNRLFDYHKLLAYPADRNEIEHYVLNNSLLYTLYDKFGEDIFDGNFQDLRTLKYYIYEKNTFELLGFYTIGVLLTLYVSSNDKIKAIKKWACCLIAFAFLFEATTYIDDKYQKDIIDEYFPRVTIFERITFMRIMLIAIVNLVRIGYKLLYRSKKKVMEDMHKVICSHNKKLVNYFESSKAESDSNVRSQLKEIDSNLGKIGTYIHTELEYIEHRSESSKAVKFFAVLGLILAVGYNFAIMKNFILSYVTTPQRKYA